MNYTQNRELSWLKFNQRVLEEARDVTVPLLERMKFVAIFTSNLDEFFMIRVGSLFDMAQTDAQAKDARSGMTPDEQLEKIYEAVAPLYKERDKTYGEIKRQLHPYGVCGLDFKELEQSERKYVKKYFKEQVLPNTTVQILQIILSYTFHTSKVFLFKNMLKMCKRSRTFRLLCSLILYFASIYPFAVSASAQSTAPPAAPRTVFGKVRQT